jgi:hypothetical protein
VPANATPRVPRFLFGRRKKFGRTSEMHTISRTSGDSCVEYRAFSEGSGSHTTPATSIPSLPGVRAIVTGSPALSFGHWQALPRRSSVRHNIRDVTPRRTRQLVYSNADTQCLQSCFPSDGSIEVTPIPSVWHRHTHRIIPSGARKLPRYPH